jgi:hypothetical protein
MIESIKPVSVIGSTRFLAARHTRKERGGLFITAFHNGSDYTNEGGLIPELVLWYSWVGCEEIGEDSLKYPKQMIVYWL